MTTQTEEKQAVKGFGPFAPAKNQQAFMKVGIQGFPGSGKTFTAALIAKGIYEATKNPKPVAFIDTESGSDFLVKKFQEWKIPFVVSKTRAFAELVEGVRAAEQHASVLIIDSITHFWKEIQDAFKKAKVAESLRKRGISDKEIEAGFASGKYKPVPRLTMYDWGPIKDNWGVFTELYMRSGLNIIMCGRAAYEYDNTEDDEGNKEITKIGTKMSVEKDLGYEPNLMLEMVKEKRDKDGRIDARLWDHACYVLKDKTQQIEGKVFIDPTFEQFRPVWNYLNVGGEHVALTSDKDSAAVFSRLHSDNLHEQKRQREIFIEEIEGELVSGFPGQSADEKKSRADLVFEVFGTRSWQALQDMDPPVLKAGLDKMRGRITEIKAQKAEAKTGGK